MSKTQAIQKLHAKRERIRQQIKALAAKERELERRKLQLLQQERNVADAIRKAYEVTRIAAESWVAKSER